MLGENSGAIEERGEELLGGPWAPLREEAAELGHP